MTKISNKKAWEFILCSAPFKGNNIFGELMPNGVYAVFSYGYHFPLFVYTNGKWYENSDRYSVTTSKHKTQTRPQGETEKSNTEEMLTLAGIHGTVPNWFKGTR